MLRTKRVHAKIDRFVTANVVFLEVKTQAVSANPTSV